MGFHEPDAVNAASRRMIEKNDAGCLGEVQVRHRRIALYAKSRQGHPLPRIEP